MRSLALVLATLILGAACAPTAEQQRAARVEALQLELDAALANWQTDVRVGRFDTSADAARTLVSRYDAVYGRWGLRADTLTQATMAYAVAAAVRVDGGEVTVDEANALLGRMRRDTERARSDLIAPDAADSLRRETAMLSWWDAYWGKNAQAFRISARHPIRCEIASASDRGKVVVCR